VKIGLLGGSFDPVHSAHMALARAAREKLGLDKVILMPSGEPPYKKCAASRADRLAMTRLAAAQEDWIEVSDIEIMRSCETYAVDSLRQLSAMYPGHEIIYLMGADAAARVHRWKGADEVVKLCRIACVSRAENDVCPEGMIALNVKLEDISSSMIRERINSGLAADGLVPNCVAKYIAGRGLYITGMPEAAVEEDLKARLRPSRFKHTLGVAQTARELALLNGVSAGKAYIAGLVHDCAKNLSDEELDSMAEISGADDDERTISQVLHAPVGAVVARERYGINDPEVISAVRRHTIGGSGMSMLDMIIYVADFIEPGRRPFPGLEKIRAEAYRDIRRGALLCAQSTRNYQAGQGAKVHPATELMIREITHGGMNNG